MRAIIINPYDRSITETNAVESYGLAEMYAALTQKRGRAVDDINSIFLNADRSEVLWVDGEGLLFPDTPIWFLGEYPSPLAGIGLILGLTEDGDNTRTRIRLEFLEAPTGVRFSSLLTTGQLKPATISGNTIKIGDPILKEKE